MMRNLREAKPSLPLPGTLENIRRLDRLIRIARKQMQSRKQLAPFWNPITQGVKRKRDMNPNREEDHGNATDTSDTDVQPLRTKTKLMPCEKKKDSGTSVSHTNESQTTRAIIKFLVFDDAGQDLHALPCSASSLPDSTTIIHYAVNVKHLDGAIIATCNHNDLAEIQTDSKYDASRSPPPDPAGVDAFFVSGVDRKKARDAYKALRGCSMTNGGGFIGTWNNHPVLYILSGDKRSAIITYATIAYTTKKKNGTRSYDEIWKWNKQVRPIEEISQISHPQSLRTWWDRVRYMGPGESAQRMVWRRDGPPGECSIEAVQKFFLQEEMRSFQNGTHRMCNRRFAGTRSQFNLEHVLRGDDDDDMSDMSDADGKNHSLFPGILTADANRGYHKHLLEWMNTHYPNENEPAEISLTMARKLFEEELELDAYGDESTTTGSTIIGPWLFTRVHAKGRFHWVFSRNIPQSTLSTII